MTPEIRRSIHTLRNALAAGTYLYAVPPQDRAGVDASTNIRVVLQLASTLTGPNDMAIAGHVIPTGRAGYVKCEIFCTYSWTDTGRLG